MDGPQIDPELAPRQTEPTSTPDRLLMDPHRKLVDLRAAPNRPKLQDATTMIHGDPMSCCDARGCGDPMRSGDTGCDDPTGCGDPVGGGGPMGFQFVAAIPSAAGPWADPKIGKMLKLAETA